VSSHFLPRSEVVDVAHTRPVLTVKQDCLQDTQLEISFGKLRAALLSQSPPAAKEVPLQSNIDHVSITVNYISRIAPTGPLLRSLRDGAAALSVNRILSKCSRSTTRFANAAPFDFN